MKSNWHLTSMLLIAVALLCSLLAGCNGPSATARPQPLILPAGLHVVGNRIEESNGRSLTTQIFHGVNRSGTEYQCTKDGTTFDGPADQASINAMLAWKVTIVRVPLNEDCWLGINGEPTGKGTATQYRQDISDYVHLLRQNKLIVILELHWSAPGTQQALRQLPMPDADHTPDFWSSVASTFKSDAFIIFEMFNEPSIATWPCWLQGSAQPNTSPCQETDFAVAGMQTLVNTVRKSGASNLILVGGIAFSNNLYGWLQYKPHDPLNNMAASFHMYPGNGCADTTCLESSVVPVLAHYPILVDEIGEFDCNTDFLQSILPWFDSHQVGYLAWAWDVYNCSTFPSLISDYSGTPTAYGIGYKKHLSTLK